MKQILVFLLFLLMIVWCMFAPVYKHVLILRHALLQKEVDYMLEVGASGRYGYIDQPMMEASALRLAEFGLAPGQLEYTVSSTSGLPADRADTPLLRGTGLRLRITYPYGSLFGIDRLLGISSPLPTDRMGASGIKMSEYVP